MIVNDSNDSKLSTGSPFSGNMWENAICHVCDHIVFMKMAAAGGSHLSGGRVNVGLLRECARRELLQCLNKQPGSKVTKNVWWNCLDNYGT